MTLDAPTLLFAGITARGCYVLVFLISGLQPRGERALLHWGASVACSIAGTLIHYTDGQNGHSLPPLAGGLSFALFGGSIALCWTGMLHFHERPVGRNAPILAGLLPGLAFMVPLQLGWGRGIAMSGAFTLLIGLVAATLREVGRRTSPGTEWSRGIVAAGLSLYLAAFTASVALLLAGRDLAAGGRSAEIALLIDHACSVLIYVGFLAMAGERSNARLTRLAVTDPLTGLANRRGVIEAVAPGGMHPGAILLIDIDHFKAINDVNGHEAGDAVLAEFAARLRRVADDGPDRPLLARWGGEEFLVALPARRAGDGVALAERIRAATEAEPFRAGPFRPAVTVSIGIAAGGGSLDALLSRADAALYAAKRGGRNRACAAPEPVAPPPAVPAAA